MNRLSLLAKAVINDGNTNGLDKDRIKKRKEENPNIDRVGLRTMVKNPTVYVRGHVRHDYHAIIKLDGWHRVFINAEFTGSNSIQFLD